MQRIRCFTTAAMLAALLLACSREEPAGAEPAAGESVANERLTANQASSGELTPDELAIEPSAAAVIGSGEVVIEPMDSSTPPDEVPELLRAPETTDAMEDDSPAPVDIADAKRPLSISLYSEVGYENAEGEMVLDVLEREFLYLSVIIDDANGAPVNGVVPKILTSGSSEVVPMAKRSGDSGEAGVYPFGVTGGTMGVEDLVIIVGDAEQIALLNVVDLQAAGYSSLAEVNGAIGWGELMKAKVKWGKPLTATFPPQIARYAGKTAKLAGFMMPLEMTKEQKHFILTSNPPSCFFHIPGGPAGAVEVFAKEPIAVSWEPVVLEGRFETLEQSDADVVYQLHDARIVAAQ